MENSQANGGFRGEGEEGRRQESLRMGKGRKLNSASRWRYSATGYSRTQYSG